MEAPPCISDTGGLEALLMMDNETRFPFQVHFSSDAIRLILSSAVQICTADENAAKKKRYKTFSSSMTSSTFNLLKR